MDLRYPQINSPSDAQNIQQIRTFLYQLVDTLNYRFGNLDAKNTQTTEQNIGLSIDAGDKVIGITSKEVWGVNWTIRKWQSGYIECFGRTTLNGSIANGSSTVTIPQQDFPITYNSAPICIITASPIDTGYCNTVVKYSSSASKESTQLAYIEATNSTDVATLDFDITYYVFGK